MIATESSAQVQRKKKKKKKKSVKARLPNAASIGGVKEQPPFFHILGRQGGPEGKKKSRKLGKRQAG